jgi:hypothetical protein
MSKNHNPAISSRAHYLVNLAHAYKGVSRAFESINDIDDVQGIDADTVTMIKVLDGSTEGIARGLAELLADAVIRESRR